MIVNRNEATSTWLIFLHSFKNSSISITNGQEGSNQFMSIGDNRQFYGRPPLEVLYKKDWSEIQIGYRAAGKWVVKDPRQAFEIRQFIQKNKNKKR